MGGGKDAPGGRITSVIQSLVEKLFAALEAYHPLAYDAPYEGVLHRPPPPAAMADFSKKEGYALPPSYKAFLELHNGWSGYVAGFTLVGISGKHTVEARRDIRETLEIFLDAWRAQHGEPTKETVAEVEGWSRDEAAYIVDMIAFGTDFNGAVLLFDPKTLRPDAEMEVLLYDTSGPSKRYKGFVDMLETDLRSLTEAIEKLRKEKQT